MDSDYHRPQGYRWPRLWDEALRQWQPSRGDLTHQAPQPAQAHQPEAALAAWGRHRGPQQRSQIGHIAVCGQRLDLQRTTYRSPSTGWPTAKANQRRATVGGVHLGILPLPPTPLETFKALFTPASQAIPGRVTRLRRQIGQEKPRVRVPLTPPRHQRTVEPPPRRRIQKAVPRPHQHWFTSRTNARSQYHRVWPAGRNLAPSLIRSSGCQPRRTMRPKSQRAHKPRSASTSTVQSGGMAGRTPRNRCNHSRRQAPGWFAGKTVQATGMPHPR